MPARQRLRRHQEQRRPPPPGSARLAAARRTRSSGVNLGRPAVRRSTRSCCSSTRISRSLVASSAPERTSRRASTRTTNQSMKSIGGWYGVPGHDANPSFRAPQGADAAKLCRCHGCPTSGGGALLSAWCSRLRGTPDHRAIARANRVLLAGELATGLEWATPTGDEAAAPSTPPAPVTVLLYSLDQAVLARVTDALAELAPGSKVHQSHDHVGTDQLKQWARNAQAIAMATRCAKHAATGFIRAHARPDATIIEADGSGSASLLRAAMRALRPQAQDDLSTQAWSD